MSHFGMKYMGLKDKR